MKIVKELFFVALGGAIGASLRFGSCALAARCFGAGFPYGTLLVNVIGAFIIGLLAGGATFHPLVRTGLIVGVLGGFTTFSSFSWDTLSLANDASGTHAMLNILANVTLAMLAVYAGVWVRNAIY